METMNSNNNNNNDSNHGSTIDDPPGEGNGEASSDRSIASASTPGTGIGTDTTKMVRMIPHYGIPIRMADPKGHFPKPGSRLGPYFCLGQLGKGTFSSIHKCAYIGSGDGNGNGKGNGNGNNGNFTFAAAKVEVSDGDFTGVLDGEAQMLDYLHQHLPAESVPQYYGYYKAQKVAALFMECLPHPDLHQLRERKEESSNSNNKNDKNDHGTTRRLHLTDAVYLCADVLIPLLQRMHHAGIVHRDVKPSNCMAVGPNSFRLVDFGLSKSFVVPATHESADPMHPYPSDRPWMPPHGGSYHQPQPQQPPQQQPQQRHLDSGDADGATPTTTTIPTTAATACFKKELAKAEFRGTSMYASLFVHQGKDYCPRDDLWSVLYVFCDLVSGGLPWMTHAANRERAFCERTKAIIYDEKKYDALLKGDAYHIAMYRREAAKKRKMDVNKLPIVPSPLGMSRDGHKIRLLERAFDSLKSLDFWSTPDYAVLQDCIRGFAREGTIPPSLTVDSSNSISNNNNSNNDTAAPPLPLAGSNVEGGVVVDDDPPVAKIHWQAVFHPHESPNYQRSAVPTFIVDDAPPCPLSDEDFVKAEKDIDRSAYDSDPYSRLPVKLRYHLTLMNDTAGGGGGGGDTGDHDNGDEKASELGPGLQLREFMAVGMSLLYEGEWDAKRCEDGGHRTSTDGYRRVRYLELLRHCEDFGMKYIHRRECYYHQVDRPAEGGDGRGGEVVGGGKRRRLTCTNGVPSLVMVSKVMAGLRYTIAAEEKKPVAPPVRISFG
jgi:serine/threonine protein kinase